MVPRLTVVLLFLLAGCTTAGGGGTPAAPSETSTAAPTTSAAGSTPNTAPRDEAPSDATAANTVAYADLSATEQRAFDAAEAGGAKFFHETRYVQGDFFDPAVADVFERHEYVVKAGTYYRLSPESGALYAGYGIRASEGTPSPNDTVVSFENLSERSEEAVRGAIENGSYDVPFGKWNSLPDDLSGVDYVRYSGTVYRLGVVVGDAWVQVWTAEEAG